MFKAALLLALAAVSSSFGAAPPVKIDPAVKAELKKLQGRWHQLRVETDKTVWDARDHETRKITTIRGYDWSHDRPLRDYESTITAFDAEGRTFDLVTTFRGEEILFHEASYKLEGDKLEIVLHKGKGYRPTTFDRPKEVDTALLVFRRMKEE